MINLYEILGVTKKATQQEIKKAYRIKSKKLHPDVGGNADEFNLLNKAYKILSDKEKRKKYDTGKNIDDILKPSNDKALSIIANILSQLLDSQDPQYNNIISNIKNILDQNIVKITLEINKFEKQIKWNQIFLKKLKCKKKKKDDFIILIISGRKIQKEQILNNLKQERSHLKNAKKVLENYSYEVPDGLQPINIFFDGSTSSTTF